MQELITAHYIGPSMELKFGSTYALLVGFNCSLKLTNLLVPRSIFFLDPVSHVFGLIPELWSFYLQQYARLYDHRFF